MKRLLVIVFCLSFLVVSSYGYDPAGGGVYRQTVLTTEQTEITLAGGATAIETTIINNGTGRLYVKFADGTIDTDDDCYIEAGDLPLTVHVPWQTIELLAGTSSAECQLIVSWR